MFRKTLFTLRPEYDTSKFLFVFAIVFTALLIDVSIMVVADVVSKQAVTFWGIAVFAVVSSLYVFGQYFIMAMTKAKNRSTKFHQSVRLVDLKRA